MKFTEIIAVIFAVTSGGCLAIIQIRKILKGELASYGSKAFKDAAKIHLDSFDKRLLLLALFSFVFFIVFLAITYW